MIQFKRDMKARPGLFVMSRPLPPVAIPAKIRGVDVPGDLRSFWAEFGGGEIFESEDILLPDAGMFGVDARTSWHFKTNGDSVGFVFHEGYCLTVIRPDLGYATLDSDTYEVQNAFTSLEDWYLGVIRSEFAARYGLELL